MKKQSVDAKVLRKIVRKNRQIDQALLKESVDLVTYIRSLGIQSRGFNLLRSSEARLRVIHPSTQTIEAP